MDGTPRHAICFDARNPELRSRGGRSMTESRGTRISRRDVLKLSVGGGAGLALGGLLDMPAAAAAAQSLKLSDVQEFTTSCNFCSCGCGMIAAVRDGKLISMEGDFDHIVNRGALCVKGISMFATHTSPKRLTTPRYRAPGSDRWEDISWDDAIARVAQKVRKTRDATWIATEKVDAPELVVDLAAGDRIQSAPRFVNQGGGPREVPVNRTDAMGFMGGAQNTNEECYLFQKAARLLGMSYVEHQARL
jgi:formate dehydrogenase major subunit